MNIQPIYLGALPNDNTGDTLREGGFKINDNTWELFAYGPARHRQASIIYKTLSGAPVFLESAGLSIDLIAPFVGTIGAGMEQRGERNAPVVITSDAVGAWTVPNNTVSYLYVQKDSLTATPVYGYSALQPYKDQTSHTSPASGQHWFDTLNNQMKVWNGSAFVATSRLFVAAVSSSGGSVIEIDYYTETEESEAIDSAVLAASASLVAYTSASLISAKSYTDLQTAATLVSANTYADNSAKKFALIFG